MSSATGTPRNISELSMAGTAPTVLRFPTTATWPLAAKAAVAGGPLFVPVPGARRATEQKLSVSRRASETTLLLSCKSSNNKHYGVRLMKA